ncbi:hypothetical protein H2509_13510 [Stappia sp. F7233]|uniref:DUF4332 domain-containing protein n=1 Tax=Stappia albiluteola TaxID=2758565 RepID=A0A839AER3_9HYPH|nr:hypothetical protein [Stappia albiluteola]MBA5777470.1 hypothetical protein [Stappia albiluteola]MBA5777508.1 hypothetical protein [Stappia albiluteola]MBA5778081.1 hypothetical protein [Stappia albiluteola]MBA5778142.1 hypothetical protein [Stappia albiluteola]
MQAKERLYLTKDKSKLVGEGDLRAAFLYAAPGDEIPASAVERFGLVDGSLAKGGKKQSAPAEDKERRGQEDKGEKGEDLSVIKGIGAAAQAALKAAGIDSFSALAAVDPASPPVVKGLSPRADWQSWVTQARELMKPPTG